MGLPLGGGVRAASRDELREEAGLAAQWVLEFAAGAYGPEGSFKLIAGADGHSLMEGGASGLREAKPVEAALAPYLRVVESVQRYAGDQATGALLLTARLVERGLLAVADGLPVAALLEGYELAARQLRGVLAAHARQGSSQEALGHVSPHAARWAPVLAAGLPDLMRGGRLELDDVEIRIEASDEEEIQWLDGVVVEPQRSPPKGRFANAGVLIVGEGRLYHSRQELSRRFTRTEDYGASLDAEKQVAKRAIERLEAAGVRLVVCRRSFDEAFLDALEVAGFLVWNDAPDDAVERLMRATGADPVPDLRHWSLEDLGQGDLEAREARRDGWTVSGPGPSATLAVPIANPSLAALARDEGERILRAAGCFMQDPRVIPGGGRWQRSAAAALHKAAGHAPGKAPLGVQIVAEALDWLADQLIVNAGRDPLSERLLEDSGGVWDGAKAVLLATGAAFEAASSILRLDGRYDRKPSRQGDLRGSDTAPVGPASGNWMDIPQHQ